MKQDIQHGATDSRLCDTVREWLSFGLQGGAHQCKGDSLTSRQAEPGSLQSRFSGECDRHNNRALTLAEKYRRQLDVLNRGFGGFTTET